jgi:hypothetical protein
MSVEKTKVTRMSRESTPLQILTSETTGERGIFQLSG